MGIISFFKKNPEERREILLQKKKEADERVARCKAREAESKKKLQESIDKFNELRHTCPICGNKTDFTAYEKGYGVGKGLVGAAIFGPMGLSAGLIGSGKIYLVCNKCGHKMKI